jgi:hypothetical protein
MRSTGRPAITQLATEARNGTQDKPPTECKELIANTGRAKPKEPAQTLLIKTYQTTNVHMTTKKCIWPKGHSLFAPSAKDSKNRTTNQHARQNPVEVE